MPKFLFTGSYSVEGIKGVVEDGGSRRREVARQVAESLDGKLEAFYFAFGGDDVVAILDVPDNVSAAAASLMIGATGAFQGKTTVLLTPEEIDQATRKKVKYTAPGR